MSSSSSRVPSAAAAFNVHDLFHACEVGDRRKAEAFLESTGADVDSPDGQDLTALQVAAANDQVLGGMLDGIF